jgi:hypothetical protein
VFALSVYEGAVQRFDEFMAGMTNLSFTNNDPDIKLETLHPILQDRLANKAEYTIQFNHRPTVETSFHEFRVNKRRFAIPVVETRVVPNGAITFEYGANRDISMRIEVTPKGKMVECAVNLNLNFNANAQFDQNDQRIVQLLLAAIQGKNVYWLGNSLHARGIQIQFANVDPMLTNNLRFVDVFLQANILLLGIGVIDTFMPWPDIEHDNIPVLFEHFSVVVNHAKKPEGGSITVNASYGDQELSKILDLQQQMEQFGMQVVVGQTIRGKTYFARQIDLHQVKIRVLDTPKSTKSTNALLGTLKPEPNSVEFKAAKSTITFKKSLDKWN